MKRDINKNKSYENITVFSKTKSVRNVALLYISENHFKVWLRRRGYLIHLLSICYSVSFLLKHMKEIYHTDM